MRPRIDRGVNESHESNGALLNMYYGNQGAQELFRNHIIETLYNALRAG